MIRAGRIPAGLFWSVVPLALGTTAALGQALLFAIVGVTASNSKVIATPIGIAHKVKLN